VSLPALLLSEGEPSTAGGWSKGAVLLEAAVVAAEGREVSQCGLTKHQGRRRVSTLAKCRISPLAGATAT